jgi:hypothetical protein
MIRCFAQGFARIFDWLPIDSRFVELRYTTVLKNTTVLDGTVYI